MGNKLFTQLILIITAITIVVAYIRPSFAAIADIQDEITRFESTVSKAEELNSALQELIATERSISRGELQALDVYLPQEINDVLIMRDIQNIFKSIELPITSLKSLAVEGFQSQVSSENINPRARDLAVTNEEPRLRFKDFELSFFGEYVHLKQIIQGLEVNTYPLEVVELNFTAAPDPEEAAEDLGLEPGVMKFELTLRAYALSATN